MTFTRHAIQDRKVSSIISGKADRNACCLCLAAEGTLTSVIGHDCKYTSDEELANLMSKTLGHMRVRDAATMSQSDYVQSVVGATGKTFGGGESARCVYSVDDNDDMGGIDAMIATRGDQAEDVGSIKPGDQENGRLGNGNDISGQDDSLWAEREGVNGEDVQVDVMPEVEDPTESAELEAMEAATEMKAVSSPGVLQGKLACISQRIAKDIRERAGALLFCRRVSTFSVSPLRLLALRR
jgi:hypothetical protein